MLTRTDLNNKYFFIFVKFSVPLKKSYSTFILTTLSFFFFSCLSSHYKAYCQTVHKLHGQAVYDINQPIPYTLIKLYNFADTSKAVAQTQTDSIGKFTLSAPVAGDYKLKIQTTTLRITVLQDRETWIPTIVIHRAEIGLKEINIKATKSFLERKADRLIVNIENSPLAVGNAIWDILGKLPGVMVQGASVTVDGSRSVDIYIDGRRVGNGSEQVNQVLRTLQASSIQRIEIFATPPPSFEASGDAVINIILKKERMLSDVGLSFRQRLFPANGEQFSNLNSELVNTNLWLSAGRFDVSALLSMNNSRENFSKNMETSETPVFQRSNASIQRSSTNFFSSSIGMTYNASKKDYLGFQILFDATPGSKGKVANDYIQSNTDGTKQAFTTVDNYKSTYNDASYIASYTHYLDTAKTSNISLVGLYERYNTSPTDFFLQTAPISTSLPVAYQRQEYETSIKSLKTDLSLTGKYLSAQFGAKFTRSSNSNQIYVNDAAISNFRFNENILAGYAEIKGKKGKFSYDVGLRNEYTYSEGETTDGTPLSISRRYNNVFPTALLKFSFKKSALALSITKRITRPEYSDFNPATYITANNQFTLTQGNPLLYPQFTYKYGLAYTIGNLNFSVSFQDKRNVRSFYSGVNVGDTIISRTINTNQRNVVLGGYYTHTILQWWTANYNIIAYNYNSYLLNNERRSSVAAYIYYGNTFSLGEFNRVELSFVWLSKQQQDYRTTTGTPTLNVAYTTTFSKTSPLEFVVGMDDILGTNKYTWSYRYPQIATANQKLSNERLLRLGINYKFKTSRLFETRDVNTNDFGEVRH